MMGEVCGSRCFDPIDDRVTIAYQILAQLDRIDFANRTRSSEIKL
jgi:hypothetical protein